MDFLQVNRRIRIPHSEFEFTFARSSGPGGQNVNKVNTKAVLRWDVLQSPSLPDDVRERFRARYGNRISTEGHLILHSQRYRDQSRNIDDCLDKLREMLTEVATRPTLRRATKVPRSAIEKRLKQKRKASQRKQLRGATRHDD